MKNYVLEKMKYNYNQIQNKKFLTTIRYDFSYNGVRVKVFFDSFDEDNIVFILTLIYDNEYACWSLNCKNDKNVEYLHKLPENIKDKIKDENNKLIKFFDNIENHIMNEKYDIINCNYDRDLLNAKSAMKNKKYECLPYLQGISHKKMLPETLIRLKNEMNINVEILKKLQKNGFTLVRTDDPKKSKKLSIILANTKIKMDKKEYNKYGTGESSQTQRNKY